MKNNIALAAIIWLFAIGLGVATVDNSWDGVAYYYLGEGRKPAAVRKEMDFSHLEGSALKLASQDRLLSDAIFKKTESNLEVQLGHFLTKDDRGGKVFACQYYDRVELSFKAVGLANAGISPKLKLDAKCKIGLDIGKMASIKIPTQTLLKKQPQDFKFEISNSESIEFYDLVAPWPTQWELESAKLYHSINSNRLLSITAESIIKQNGGQPIQMVW